MPQLAPVEWASCVEAMQRGLGGFPHERLHQDTGILPVSIYFRAGRMPTLLLFIQRLTQRLFSYILSP
ncbi:hypothetical protein BJP36_41435 [Moorena producens JHB]|uniref:Uncharacterized protein n=1 Tax=Moorena producens (strain JHB) TaxID=1454205 RepID=A0A9Q9SSG5_MOOP1|nr:hypothetical protein [Moorena producens]WAN68829.1 hypothetical protein BJP36_41435 [Moorena producens JHB]